MIEYNGPIEQAGHIFFEIANWLLLINDVKAAVQAIGAVDWLVAKFEVTASTISSRVKGYMLEATENGRTVQIFRDAGDGTPQVLGHKDDVGALVKSIEESGTSQTSQCLLFSSPFSYLV